MSTVTAGGRKPVVTSSITVKRNSFSSTAKTHNTTTPTTISSTATHSKDSHNNHNTNITTSTTNKDKDSIDPEQTLNTLCTSFLTLCSADPPTSPSILESKLNEIRSTILFNGLC